MSFQKSIFLSAGILLIIFLLGCTNSTSSNESTVDLTSSNGLDDLDRALVDEETDIVPIVEETVRDLETVPLIEPEKQFNTSDYLSQITALNEFSFPIENEVLVQRVNLKLTGYLKEIDPKSIDSTATSVAQARYVDNAYTLDQGELEWTIEYNSSNRMESCGLRISGLTEGKSEITKLNVFRDPGNPSGLPLPSGTLLFGYNSQGQGGKEELTLFGNLYIPIDLNTAISNCPEETEEGYTQYQTVTVQFPLHFFNKNYKGTQTLTEPLSRFENKEGLLQDRMVLIRNDVTSVLPINEREWIISWDLNLPK